MPPKTTRGQKFARMLRRDFELGPDEAELAAEIVKVLDTLDDLDQAVTTHGTTTFTATGSVAINPAVIEARQQRVVLVRLLGALGLSIAEDGTPTIPTGHQSRSRAANTQRWGRERSGRSTAQGV